MVISRVVLCMLWVSGLVVFWLWLMGMMLVCGISFSVGLRLIMLFWCVGFMIDLFVLVLMVVVYSWVVIVMLLFDELLLVLCFGF